jgi:hypothetical protein
MPIDYQIDHEHRLVTARARGKLTDADVFGYQQEVWSRRDVTGYDELIDMTACETIEVPSGDRVLQLAQLSASMDAESASKLAIVAPRDLAYGLGRMYESYRGVSALSTKEVNVFRSMIDAVAWLGKSVQ